MRDRDVVGYEIDQGVFDRLVAVAERTPPGGGTRTRAGAEAAPGNE